MSKLIVSFNQPAVKTMISGFLPFFLLVIFGCASLPPKIKENTTAYRDTTDKYGLREYAKKEFDEADQAYKQANELEAKKKKLKSKKNMDSHRKGIQ